MAELSSGETRGQPRGLEYNLYFVMIFLAAVPFGLVGTLRDVLRLRTLNLKGPLARAWLEADRITPLIFSTP